MEGNGELGGWGVGILMKKKDQETQLSVLCIRR